MIILGIDPGAKGGLALISSKPLRYIRGIRTPIIKHRGKNLVDIQAIGHFIKPTDVDVAIIEQVNAFGMGATSAFSFGRTTGAAEAVAIMLADRTEWITPQKWKKHFKLSAEKQESLDAAKLMWGDVEKWDVKANDGIAEASLIARYFIDKMQ